MTSSRLHDSRLAEWLQEHRAILAKVARSFAHGAADVAELQQEMAYQLWVSLPRYAGSAKPSTWVYRVCLNTALTWKRGEWRRGRRIDTDANLQSIAVDAASPADTAERREWLDKLYAALREMPAAERALVLLMLEGLSYREMAEVTGMSENHVGVALTRARRGLAERLKGVIDELE